MKVLKRTVFGITGTAIAASCVVVETGCSLRTTLNLNEKNGILSIKAEVSDCPKAIQHATSDQIGCFDLDSREFEVLTHNGRNYSYFYDIDCLYDEDSQLLVLHDDPAWGEYFGGSFTQSELTNENEYVFTGIQDGVIKGTFTTSLSASVGMQDAHVGVRLNLAGGSPIPTWDNARWYTLSRQLFLIKDGQAGSPDPIVMNVTGNASDVFGYLYEVGITDGSTTIDGQDWSMTIDSAGEWADIYIDNEFVTSVLLH
jgi:hypothetical protein